MNFAARKHKCTAASLGPGATACSVTQNESDWTHIVSGWAAMNPTLDALFGSRAAAQVLFFLQNYGEGHARRIASTFEAPRTGIVRQLKRLEAHGLLVSRQVGSTRVFSWNPRSITARDLRVFLEAELERLPRDVTERYFRQRQRPRRAGKQ
jgi:DNA-binding transcriptional ArsR family regulator